MNSSSFLAHCDGFQGSIRRFSGYRKRGYVLNLLFASRQLAHYSVVEGFSIVNAMFKFLLCVLHRPAEEVFPSVDI